MENTCSVRTVAGKHWAAMLCAGVLAVSTGWRAAAQFGPMPPAEVTFTTVETRDLPVEISMVGVTEASKVVEVRARVQGFLETREFDEGALVKEGTQLFSIDPRPFEADLTIAKARVEQAEARLHLAEQELRRLRSVSVEGAVAQSDLDAQLAEQTNAAAALNLARAEMAKAQLELDYTTVEAPLTGYIGKALRDIGSVVDTAQNGLLAVMHQVDPIYVSFPMTEREFLKWRKHVAEGNYKLDGVAEPYLEIELLDGSIYPLKGSIDFEGVELDTQMGSVEMRATFANPDNFLKPGQFVKAYLRGYVRENLIGVPQRAVSASPEGSYVYVLDGENHAQQRLVKTGAWTGQDWVIESGLQPGEKVVVDGVSKIMPGAVVKPMPLGGAPAGAAAE